MTQVVVEKISSISQMFASAQLLEDLDSTLQFPLQCVSRAWFPTASLVQQIKMSATSEAAELTLSYKPTAATVPQTMDLC